MASSSIVAAGRNIQPPPAHPHPIHPPRARPLPHLPPPPNPTTTLIPNRRENLPQSNLDWGKFLLDLNFRISPILECKKTPPRRTPCPTVVQILPSMGSYDGAWRLVVLLRFRNPTNPLGYDRPFQQPTEPSHPKEPPSDFHL